MTRNQTADLGAQLGQQRDRLTESVGTLTDKIDVGALTDKIDTDALRTRAEAGVEGVLDSATDSKGRPKRGLLIGLVVGAITLVLVRRVLQ